MYVKTDPRDMYLKLIGKRTCSITLLFAHNTINEGYHDIAMTYGTVLNNTKQRFLGKHSCHWQNEEKFLIFVLSRYGTVFGKLYI